MLPNSDMNWRGCVCVCVTRKTDAIYRCLVTLLMHLIYAR